MNNKQEYLKVRRAIQSNKIKFLARIKSELPPFDKISNLNEKYWILLIQAELFRFEKKFHKAKSILESMS